MGGMSNIVVNTIVRMFTRKAVGKAMKSAKKSMGAKKGNDQEDRVSLKRRQERDG